MRILFAGGASDHSDEKSQHGERQKKKKEDAPKKSPGHIRVSAAKTHRAGMGENRPKKKESGQNEIKANVFLSTIFGPW
jgi:hypothetical protein